MEQDMIFRVPMLFLGKERFTSSTSQCLCNNLNMLAKQYKVDARRAEWARRRQGPYGHTSSQLDELVHNKLKLYSLQKHYLNNIVPLSKLFNFPRGDETLFGHFLTKCQNNFGAKIQTMQYCIKRHLTEGRNEKVLRFTPVLYRFLKEFLREIFLQDAAKTI